MMMVVKKAMKKRFGLVVFVFLFLALFLATISGCGCDAGEEGAGKDVTPDGEDGPDELTPEQARRLAADTLDMILYLASGGDESAGTFEHEGQEMVYLEAQIGTTRSELKEYLGDYVTPGQAEDLIEEMYVIEHQGQLAIPVSGSGLRSSDLESLELTLESRDLHRTVYRFRLADAPQENYFTLTFAWVDGKWLIDDRDFELW
ncbi:MAG: hypothetical protein GX364_00055 [Firmicutes bacterium]|jgi:hypothetical protein|nr:hypothetical protein [Bacillota bacterium]